MGPFWQTAGLLEHCPSGETLPALIDDSARKDPILLNLPDIDFASRSDDEDDRVNPPNPLLDGRWAAPTGHIQYLGGVSVHHPAERELHYGYRQPALEA
jgi:hypothetical protein